MTRRCLYILFCICMFASPVTNAVQAGDQAPSWVGTALDGNTVRFPDPDAGQTTVLVFWATWCPYCQAFMPHLKKIEKDYADRGMRVIAINAKEQDDGDPRGYMRSKGYSFLTVLNGDSIAEDYAVKFIPGLMVVDAKGLVIWRRGWTELPAGQQVADLWDGQVREVLDRALQ